MKIRCLLYVTTIVCYLTIETAYGNVRKKRIVGGEPAELPPEIETDSRPPKDPDSITFVYGAEDRSAKVEGVKDNRGYYSFLGVRYAEPPTGLYRLQRPVLLEPDGNITATSYGAPCVQPNKNETTQLGSEDCLFLNIYTPILNRHGPVNLPVLFWIHGGGFRRGSGNQYGVTSLVTKNITVVTVNYRLGSLGWLGASNKQMPGNVGLFDIRAAFEWTRKYVYYFGGDPNRLFIGGQGSGASVAMLFAQSSFTAPYISGVFSMSGSSVSAMAVDYSPTNTSETVTTASRCAQANPFEVVRCLQEVTSSTIVDSDSVLSDNRGSEFEGALTQLMSPGPVIEGCDDGRFLPYFLNNAPLDFLKNKKKHAPYTVPLLMGVTKHETSKLILGKYKDDVARKLAIPDYLNKHLPVRLLKANTGFFTNGTINKLLSSLFSNNEYLSFIVSTVKSVANEFEKVVEMTTDALFNLPAITTSALWYKNGGNAYFYSFEYTPANAQSESEGPDHFLDGLPLGSKIFKPPSFTFPKIRGTTTTQAPPLSKPTVGHGDDLKYIFDKQTLEGNPIPEASLREAKDLQVKDTFSNIVAEFIKTGKPHSPELNQEWPVFQHNTSDYVVIGDKPTVQKQFRVCQLALWGGFVETLQSAVCKFPGMDKILSTVPSLLKDSLLDTTRSITSIPGTLGGIVTAPVSVLGVGGLTQTRTPDGSSQQQTGGAVGGVVSSLGGGGGGNGGALGGLLGGPAAIKNAVPTSRPGGIFGGLTG